MNIEKLKGKSIFLEGPDFSGKTTQLKRVEKYFAENYPELQVSTYRQPGGTPLGQEIREVLFNMGFDMSSLMAERFLFSADHADFVDKILWPNKANPSQLILCDRYNPISNIVYGSFGRNIPIPTMLTINSICTQAYSPDLVIVLHITEEEMLERLKARQAANGELNRLDLESISFKRMLFFGYNNLKNLLPLNEKLALRDVDANGDEDEVFNKIISVIEKEFE